MCFSSIKEINELLSKGMSSIYLEVAIRKILGLGAKACVAFLLFWFFMCSRHWNTVLVSRGVTFISWGEGASLALVGHPYSGASIRIPHWIG